MLNEEEVLSCRGSSCAEPLTSQCRGKPEVVRFWPAAAVAAEAAGT